MQEKSCLEMKEECLKDNRLLIKWMLHNDFPYKHISRFIWLKLNEIFSCSTKQWWV